jgi:hypothetical protein
MATVADIVSFPNTSDISPAIIAEDRLLALVYPGGVMIEPNATKRWEGTLDEEPRRNCAKHFLIGSKTTIEVDFA